MDGMGGMGGGGGGMGFWGALANSGGKKQAGSDTGSQLLQMLLGQMVQQQNASLLQSLGLPATGGFANLLLAPRRGGTTYMAGPYTGPDWTQLSTGGITAPASVPDIPM